MPVAQTTDPNPALPGPSPRLTLRGVLLYRRADALSGWLLGVMAVFSPWAFGTSQPWSIWSMNVLGYVLGGLLAVKLWMRGARGFRPGRWDWPEEGPPATLRWLTGALAAVTALLLGYCLVAALNARASYRPDDFSFVYHAHVRWLPHSYDRGRTWLALANYLALAFSFWAARDWILGKTTGEEREERVESVLTAGRILFPARLRTLLWVLSVNGGLIALEGILQRLEGSGNLLFLVKPRVNSGAEAQFGPFAYRANAAQYLNLLWPVTLGFWWSLRRLGHAGRGWSRWARHRHHILIAAAVVMAAAPVISTSRGGAIISLGSLATATVMLFLAFRKEEGHLKLAVLALFGGALALGLSLGWDKLAGRMDELGEGYSLREEMYKTADTIARDHPVFGTGPGTFRFMFQFYRGSVSQYWPSQLHNDWLEFRTDFGWLGFSFILLALALVVARWFVPCGIGLGRRFVFLTWLGLAGCLVHARWDFPFQMYSIVFLFLLLCAILGTLGRREAGD